MGRFADLANEALQGRGTSDLQLPTGLAPQIDEAGSARVDALGAQSMDLINGKGASEVPQPPPIKKIVTTFDENGNPVHDYQGISDTAHKFLQGLMQDGAQARQAYDAAISQVSSIRQAMEANPLITQIGRLANAYAANVVAPTPAGTFARSAAEVAYGTLKDRPEDLAAQEAKLASQKIATQVPLLNALETSGKIEELKQYREQREEDRRRGQVQGLADDFDKLAKNQSLTMEYVNARIAASPFIKPEEAEALRNQAWAAQTGYQRADEKARAVKFQDFKNDQDYAEARARRQETFIIEQNKIAKAEAISEGRAATVSEHIKTMHQAREKLESDAFDANANFRLAAVQLGLPADTPPEKVMAEFGRRTSPDYKSTTDKPRLFTDNKDVAEMQKNLLAGYTALNTYKSKYDRMSKDIKAQIKLLPEEQQKMYAEPEAPAGAQATAGGYAGMGGKGVYDRYLGMSSRDFKDLWLSGKTGMSQAEASQVMATLVDAERTGAATSTRAGDVAAGYGSMTPGEFQTEYVSGRTGLSQEEAQKVMARLRAKAGGAAPPPQPIPGVTSRGAEGRAPAATPPSAVTPTAAPAPSRTPTPYPGTSVMSMPIAQPYTPLIMKYAAQYGVDPEQIARTIWEESKFNPRARAGDSHGYGGFSQAQESTAKKFGFDKDKANDPEASIQFMARYLAYLKAKLGDERLATLAYQTGEANLRKGTVGPIGRKRIKNVHGIEYSELPSTNR